MRFGAASGAVRRQLRTQRGSPALDLAAFRPVAERAGGAWRHAVRVIDNRSRVTIPELAVLVGFDGCGVAASVKTDRWELSAEDGLIRCPVDARHRVVVPVGVRQQLGLVDDVVVSVSADRHRIAVWPAQLLDAVVETPR